MEWAIIIEIIILEEEIKMKMNDEQKINRNIYND